MDPWKNDPDSEAWYIGGRTWSLVGSRRGGGDGGRADHPHQESHRPRRPRRLSVRDTVR